MSADTSRPWGRVSLVNGAGSVRIARNIHAEELVRMIRIGEWRQRVEAIRAEPDKDKRNALKKALPAAMVSGEFLKREHGRARENLVRHSGLVGIDIDGQPRGLVEGIRDTLFEDRHVAAAFVSPSGTGVKLWVRADASAETHTAAFAQIAEHFGKAYNIASSIDHSCKNLERLCYVSFDAGARWRADATPFPFNLTPSTLHVTPSTLHLTPYTTGSVEGVVGRIARLNAAEARDRKSAVLVDLYRKFIQAKISPKPEGRNEWLCEVTPFLVRCFSEEVAEGLVALALHVNSDVWHGAADEHLRSFSALWKGAEEKLVSTFTDPEKALYAQLNAPQRSVFRICRGLWEFHEKKPFQLASDHLGQRLDVTGGENGWRRLRECCALGIIRPVDRGAPRGPNQTGKSAVFDWALG